MKIRIYKTYSEEDTLFDTIRRYHNQILATRSSKYTNKTSAYMAEIEMEEYNIEIIKEKYPELFI